MVPPLAKLLEAAPSPDEVARAARALRVDADAGDAEARLALGLLLYEGHVGRREVIEGLRLIRLAAEQGHAEAAGTVTRKAYRGESGGEHRDQQAQQGRQQEPARAASGRVAAEGGGVGHACPFPGLPSDKSPRTTPDTPTPRPSPHITTPGGESASDSSPGADGALDPRSPRFGGVPPGRPSLIFVSRGTRPMSGTLARRPPSAQEEPAEITTKTG